MDLALRNIDKIHKFKLHPTLTMFRGFISTLLALSISVKPVKTLKTMYGKPI